MKTSYIIKPAKPDHRKAWISMSHKLWPKFTEADLESIVKNILKSPRQTAFLCFSPDGEAVAFVNVSLRTDYVEGAESSPCGYVEGLFVEKKHRHAGLASTLIQEAEKWVLKRRAKEIGSDTGLKNIMSQRFHKAYGFKEAGRNVHYIKKLSN